MKTFDLKMTALADSIREKSGINDALSIDEMVGVVDNISAKDLIPELDNEGIAGDLMSGKELVGSDGEVVVGTFSIDSELNTQDGLIAQIQAAVDSLPEAGGGGSSTIESVTCTVLEDGPCMYYMGEFYYVNDSGICTKKEDMTVGQSLMVMKNSIIVISATTASGGVTPLITGNSLKAYHVDDDFYINANM
jgi:hypothetical protein